jgi:hypothetical protein
MREDEARRLKVTDFSRRNPEVLLSSNWWLPLVWSSSLVK